MVEIIKKYWFILLIGLLLRLVIAPFTFHPDVKAPALAGAVFLRDGQTNPYQFSSKLAPSEVLDDAPMSYLISLPFYAFGRVLVNSEVEKIFFQNHNLLFGNPAMWVYLLYAKLPLIIFDLMVAVMLSSCVAVQHRGKLLSLWIFNPFTLWATAAVGQIDIYIVFFIILSFILIKKEKMQWAALSLGLGGAIKIAPFLLLPLFLGLNKSFKKKAKLFTIAILPYLISVLPYLPSPDFRQNALLAPQLGKSLFAQIPLSGGEGIIIFIAALIFIYLYYLQKNRNVDDFLNFLIIVFLLTLSITHFHIQWILWVIPFILIWLLDNRENIVLPVIGLGLSLVMMIFLFESSLQFKLFAPLFPQLDQVFGLADILRESQLNFLRSVSASIFAGCSAFLAYKILQQK